MPDIIETIERERNRLENIGVRDAIRIGRSLRVDVIRAFEAGVRNFQPIVNEHLQELNGLINEGVTASHLTGMRRTVLIAEPALKRRAQFGVYESTIDFVSQRLDLTDEQVLSVSEAYAPLAAQATTNVTVEVNRKLLAAVARSQEAGDTVPEGVARMRRALNGVTGDARNAHVLATIFRTNTQMAFSAGRWHAGQDSVIADLLWGFKYRTVGDSLVRHAHRLMDGTTLPKGHPRWQVMWPPNGWNCRCTVIEIYEPSQARDVLPPVEIEGEEVTAAPDEGFDFNPGIAISRTIGDILN